MGLDGGEVPEKVYTIPRDAKPGPQDELGASITLPALMEFAKNPPETRITLPVALVTNQGVTIGRWLDYALSPEGDLQVTLELVPNLKEAAQGLTVEAVKQSFAGAGINLVVNQPGPVEMPKKEPASKSRAAGMALF